MSARYEVFQDKRGAWRWRLRAENNEIVSQSEAYTRKADAVRGADDADEAAKRALYLTEENAREVDEERRQDEHDAEVRERER